LAFLAKKGCMMTLNQTTLLVLPDFNLKARFFPYNRFLQAKFGRNTSYIWRRIHSARDLLRKGSIWKIEDGRKKASWLVILLMFELWEPVLEGGLGRRFFRATDCYSYKTIPLSSLTEQHIYLAWYPKGVFTVKVPSAWRR